MSAALTRVRAELPIVAVAAVIGLVTSPILAVYTVTVCTPIALVAWLESHRRPQGDAVVVAAAAGGLAIGAALYFVLAVVVAVVDRSA